MCNQEDEENPDALSTTRTSRPSSEQDDGRFPERLSEAMEGRSARAFALDSGISGTVLRAYLAGKSEPTRPALVAMANAAKVSVTWLATGEGPKEVDSPPLESPHQGGDVVDYELLKDVVRILEELEEEEGQDWGPVTKGELVVAVYDYLFYEENPAPEDRERVFKFMKSIIKGVSNVGSGEPEGEDHGPV